MTFQFFVGADISKPFIDFVIIGQDGKKLLYQQVNNTSKDLQTFIKRVSKEFDVTRCLFCMENTGIYNENLLQELHKKEANIWLEKAIQIKQSLGLQRGKSDKVDAYRIALYASRHQQDARLWQPERKVIVQLKRYTALRSRLVEAISKLKVPLQEQDLFWDKKDAKLLSKHCQASIDVLKKDLKAVEMSIKKIIKEDEYLNHLFNLVTSVDGIGPVVAHEMIIATGEFKRITDPRKFACYSGVVPFEHSSGISIRGRNRVSSMANKNMKKLLHMSALVNIKLQGDLQDYYQRKVAEGKNKMSVLNALRNKIITRVFACVRNEAEYQRNFLSQNRKAPIERNVVC